ncbi:ceramide synthase [Raphidocelis subcapitata]|uniref:Ceramide synthase n=1 Tax=Raphidocelis subcapitata TaxID=307507 RepID=A0A2V0P5P5_9CHLO|nr:ceramide synthase [Raphidocelis subcapitata]|eukprot:GBF94252.1 ceramide synthase [Raphidocelis subcapitata]
MAALRSLLPPLEGGVEDLLLPLYQGLTLIALRLAAEKLLVPRLRRALKSRAPAAAAGAGAGAGGRGSDRRAERVVDNAFLVLFIAPLSAWGWWVMLRHNGPCTPSSTRGCLEGWPGHPVTPEFRLWWLSLGGLYAGEMIGTLLGGVGFKLGLDMLIHHVLTVWLMLYAYFGGLHRYGTLATAIFDTSNTFLHAAKALHETGLPSLGLAADALFKLFAAVFFAVRVAMPPFCMLAPGLDYGRVLPPVTYAVTNGLMLSVYVMQLNWFYKIVRIARGGAVEHGAGPKTKAAAAAPPSGAAGALPPPAAAAAGGVKSE